MTKLEALQNMGFESGRKNTRSRTMDEKGLDAALAALDLTPSVDNATAWRRAYADGQVAKAADEIRQMRA